MITTRTLQFLKKLSSNNNKEWMDANRGEYEHAKQNYADLVTALLRELSAFEPAFASIPAKECIFRLNRDVRFSEDKSPYKTHFGAFFSTGGKKGRMPVIISTCSPAPASLPAVLGCRRPIC